MTTHDDYLWDGSGEPDALMAELERELAPLRHRGRAPVAGPATLPVAAPAARAAEVRTRWAAVAAFLLLGGLAAFFAAHRPGGGAPGWVVSIGESGASAKPGGAMVVAVSRPVTIRGGGGLDLVLQPGGRLMLGPAERDPRVELERGTVEARAPGGLAVGTPHGEVRLWAGSRATVALAEDDGTVSVAEGQARITSGAATARVARGMDCTFTARDPGLPIRSTAGDDLRYAVRMMQDRRSQGKAVYAVGEMARAEDAGTLWNLALRLEGDPRERVLRRLMELVPLPRDLPEEKALGMHPGVLDAWWDAIAGSKAGP